MYIRKILVIFSISLVSVVNAQPMIPDEPSPMEWEAIHQFIKDKYNLDVIDWSMHPVPESGCPKWNVGDQAEGLDELLALVENKKNPCGLSIKISNSSGDGSRTINFEKINNEWILVRE